MKAMLQKINDHFDHFEKKDLLIKSWHTKSLSPETNAIMWRYYPLTERYFFELNPSFVCDYKDINEMNDYPFVMLRDGFLGISYFFLKNPKPLEKGHTLFLIPKKFETLVPTYWKEKVMLYSFEFQEENPGPFDNAYTYGQISPETFISTDYVTITTDLYADFKSYRNYFLTPFRSTTFFEKFNNSAYTRTVTSNILNLFGHNVKFEDSFQPGNYENIGKGDVFSNLDRDNFYIYDDFLFHFFSSRGAYAHKYKGYKKKNVIKEINLSLYHKIIIQELSEPSNYLLEKKIEMKLRGIVPNFLSERFFYYAQELFKEQLQRHSFKKA